MVKMEDYFEEQEAGVSIDEVAIMKHLIKESTHPLSLLRELWSEPLKLDTKG
ncbi:MAG: hypothetical protein KKE00_07820 [Proteobacteria bacterium]|nr:hypothetical protein [Pseudomonadota bacterium]MBU2567975.1 hypothetical protein [Elusimicrobiota bacterium]